MCHYRTEDQRTAVLKNRHFTNYMVARSEIRLEPIATQVANAQEVDRASNSTLYIGEVVDVSSDYSRISIEVQSPDNSRKFVTGIHNTVSKYSSKTLKFSIPTLRSYKAKGGITDGLFSMDSDSPGGFNYSGDNGTHVVDQRGDLIVVSAPSGRLLGQKFHQSGLIYDNEDFMRVLEEVKDLTSITDIEDADITVIRDDSSSRALVFAAIPETLPDMPPADIRAAVIIRRGTIEIGVKNGDATQFLRVTQSESKISRVDGDAVQDLTLDANGALVEVRSDADNTASILLEPGHIRFEAHDLSNGYFFNMTPTGRQFGNA